MAEDINNIIILQQLIAAAQQEDNAAAAVHMQPGVPLRFGLGHGLELLSLCHIYTRMKTSEDMTAFYDRNATRSSCSLNTRKRRVVRTQ